jgi:nucleoid DNA-binding protein
VNKSDLARLIAERRRIHQRKSDAIVNVIFSAMAGALKKRERIERDQRLRQLYQQALQGLPGP